MSVQGKRVLLFTGNGKGKTTAALGIALRCFGHDMPVAIVQFIKSQDDTGEAKAIRQLDGIELFVTGEGFVFDSSADKLAKHRAAAANGLECAAALLRDAKHKVVILDEVCVAVHKKLIDERDVLRLITDAAAGTAIVMTGRHAPQALIDVADTVTEMIEIKHGLKSGIASQQGIEK